MHRILGICTGLVLVVTITMPVWAEVYRWTDENGKVHFGDRQPEDTSATNIDLPDTPKRSDTASFASTRHVKTNTPIKPNDSTRRVKFDKVVIDLSDNDSSEAVHTIGRTYEGATCKSGNHSTVYLKRNHAEVNNKLYKSHFLSLLKDNGYNVIDDELQIFDGMKSQTEELQIAAVIKDIEVNRCFRRNIAKQIDVADYIKIEWKVFDPLNREIIYETTSEGSSRETYDAHSPRVAQLGGVGAFRSAISNLLAQSDFAAALSRTTANTKAAASTATALPIKLSYTNSPQESFTDQVEQLKAGTVTIRSPHGHGSGFVISSDGYVLTNAHVVGKATEVLVIADAQRSKAHTVRQDIRRDVALLKLDENILLPAQSLATSAIGVGHNVYLIGTPLDESLGHTITRGIISAERRMEDGLRYYQTDAAINSGNSGGPAFNEHGEVVGIAVSGLFNSSGSSLNINFLIPIDDAIKVLNIQ